MSDRAEEDTDNEEEKAEFRLTIFDSAEDDTGDDF